MDQIKGNLICDGEFEIVKITENLYDAAIELHQKYFMKYENISIAADLLSSQESIDEMEILVRAILKDGVSFAARHCETQQFVALCMNKILCPSVNCTLEDVFAKFKSPSMLSVGSYLSRMEDTFDLYKEWNVDCVLEIVFLSTHTDFGRRGLACKLSQFAIEYAQKILNDAVPDEELPAHVRGLKPKAVCAVFTSIFSQRIGEKLGMQVVNKISHTEFSYGGKTYAEKIDPIHENSVFAALRL